MAACSSGVQLGVVGAGVGVGDGEGGGGLGRVSAVVGGAFPGGFHVGLGGGGGGGGVGGVGVVLGRPASGEPWQAVSARRAQRAAVAGPRAGRRVMQGSDLGLLLV